MLAQRSYRWFGESDICRMPTKAERARFLDERIRLWLTFVEALPTLMSMSSTEALAPDIQALAAKAVKDFPQYFWWWNKEFIPQSPADIREIILALRKGDRRAWNRAQELHKCL